MASRKRTQQALSILLPIGVLGASSVLAIAQASAVPAASEAEAATEGLPTDVAARLQAIRDSASDDAIAALIFDRDEKLLLAQWVNIGSGSGGIGWRNGGWRNGPWRNGPWRNAPWGNGPWANGWHNWGNGGWHNWRNGGWNNWWHNW